MKIFLLVLSVLAIIIGNVCYFQGTQYTTTIFQQMLNHNAIVDGFLWSIFFLLFWIALKIGGSKSDK